MLMIYLEPGSMVTLNEALIRICCIQCHILPAIHRGGSVYPAYRMPDGMVFACAFPNSHVKHKDVEFKIQRGY